MAIERLTIADYKKLKNKPIINQDINAEGFTPVANTYYRHTDGKIYFYNGTEYKAMTGDDITFIQLNTEIKEVSVDESGIYTGFADAEIEYNDGEKHQYTDVDMRLPIVAGDDVSFELDEENRLVKIKARGGIQLYGTAVESEGDETPEEIDTEQWLPTRVAYMYEGQRFPEVGDLVIYEFDIPNSKGQNLILCRITSSEDFGDPKPYVEMRAICFLQGASGGGGTTLNKYTTSLLKISTNDHMKLLCKIVKECKGRLMILAINEGNIGLNPSYGDTNDINVFLHGVGIPTSSKPNRKTIGLTINSNTGAVSSNYLTREVIADASLELSTYGDYLKCVYYNDVEITA